MKKLLVFYKGWGEKWLLGTLADNGQEILFEYSPEAISQGLELSPRYLKLRPDAYGSFPSYLSGLPGLINDALPDGWGLLLMDRAFRRAGKDVATTSALDRLAFIGDRAMGALSFEPGDDGEVMPETLSLLSLAKEVRLVASGKDSEALKQLALMGGSPHGARPKVLVNYDADTKVVSLSPEGGGVPWLVKFPAQQEYKEVCALEALYAKLAFDCGVDMPETRYFDLGDDLSAFGVRRFDRESGMRVPMHTLAGLLHSDFRIPSIDYTTLLRATRFLTKDEREVKKAYLRCVFNVVMNNRDDHAKNISFCLSQDRQWKLSPGYDLTFSSGPGGEHQMDVCGEGRNVSKAHLIKLAMQGEVDEGYVLNVIARVSEVAIRFTQEASAFAIRKPTIRTIDALIRANLARMI
jgi:serine/threonine-protein kinase HipA